MQVETEKFVLDQIEWNYRADSTLGGGRASAPPVKGLPRSARVTCKECRHQWQWRRDISVSASGIGGSITLTCTKCAVTEDISPTLFR